MEETPYCEHKFGQPQSARTPLKLSAALTLIVASALATSGVSLFFAAALPIVEAGFLLIAGSGLMAAALGFVLAWESRSSRLAEAEAETPYCEHTFGQFECGEPVDKWGQFCAKHRRKPNPDFLREQVMDMAMREGKSREEAEKKADFVVRESRAPFLPKGEN